MKVIKLIANKTWEVEPLLNALLNDQFRPRGLGLPRESPYHYPRRWKQGSEREPRAIFEIEDTLVEIWCIQDIMEPNGSSSSTRKKMSVLPDMFKDRKPSLVIAFGTACFDDPTSYNGCVVIGSNVFIYDPFEGDTNREDLWDGNRTGVLITSSVNPKIFSHKGNAINHDYRVIVESKLLSPPLNPSERPMIISAVNYIVLSVVNITNYDDYAWADREGIQKVKKELIKAPIGAVETTLGLIALKSDAPYMFVAGIADRCGYFNMEVAPRRAAQNFVASFNAGVAVANILPRLTEYI